MADDFFKSATGWLKKATETASDVAETVKNEYEKSGAKDKVDKKTKQAKVFLDETGVSDKAAEISSNVSEHLDAVSGKKILDLVEERLELQSSYNDILATKLEEALNRIETLENQIAKRKQ